MNMIFVYVLALASVTQASIAAKCSGDIDCSLNGMCSDDGTCVCDKPWTGPSCGVLGYRPTPVAGKDLFPINKTHKTWNGPIIGPDTDGKFHLYNPFVDKHVAL